MIVTSFITVVITLAILGAIVVLTYFIVAVWTNHTPDPPGPTPPDPPGPTPPDPDLELNIWPSLGYDRKNTGRTTNNGPLGNTVSAKWISNFLTANNNTTPVIDKDGNIYVTYNDSAIRAFNPDGTLKWSTTLVPFGIIYSSPTIGNDGNIYFGSVQNNVYSIKSTDGSINWYYGTSGPFYSSSKIGVDGTIYINSDKLYALNPDGTLKWNYNTNGIIYQSPAIISNGNIYISSNGKVYLIDSNGNMINNITLDLGSSVQGTPSIGSDGTIYVGADLTLYAVDTGLNNILWNFPTGNGILGSASIGADGTIYLSSDKLYAINPDGTEKWTFTQATNFDQNIVDNNGIIYTGSSELNNLNLYAINSDGTLKWSYLTVGTGDEYIKSSPVIDKNNVIYIVPRNGKVYALE